MCSLLGGPFCLRFRLLYSMLGSSSSTGTGMSVGSFSSTGFLLKHLHLKVALLHFHTNFPFSSSGLLLRHLVSMKYAIIAQNAITTRQQAMIWITVRATSELSSTSMKTVFFSKKQ